MPADVSLWEWLGRHTLVAYAILALRPFVADRARARNATIRTDQGCGNSPRHLRQAAPNLFFKSAKGFEGAAMSDLMTPPGLKKAASPAFHEQTQLREALITLGRRFQLRTKEPKQIANSVDRLQHCVLTS